VQGSGIGGKSLLFFGLDYGDRHLIRKLMDVTSAQTKTDAIHQAASEFIRRKRLEWQRP